MATLVNERKRYTPEERKEHLKATKGMSFSEQKDYCEKKGISVNTLRSWRRAAEGTTSAKSKGGKKKPAKKKSAAKKKRGPGRPKGSGKKKSAAKKKRGPGRPKGSGKKRGRKPGRPKGSTTKTTSSTASELKQRVKDKLVVDFEDRLSGGEGTLSEDLKDLLTDIHNAL